MTTYIGAVLNSGILSLTIQHWTAEGAAFPLFIFVVASFQVALVGCTLGPPFRRLRARRVSGVRAEGRLAW